MPTDPEKHLVGYWPTRELNGCTADAVALMTLYVTGRDADDAGAADLLEQLFAAPGGTLATIGGLQSLCGALLVLLELHTGLEPEEVLQRVGAMAASAGAPPFR